MDAEIPGILVEIHHGKRSGGAAVAVGADAVIRVREREIREMHREISQAGSCVIAPIMDLHGVQGIHRPQIHLPPGIGFLLSVGTGSHLVVAMDDAIHRAVGGQATVIVGGLLAGLIKRQIYSRHSCSGGMGDQNDPAHAGYPCGVDAEEHPITGSHHIDVIVRGKFIGARDVFTKCRAEITLFGRKAMGDGGHADHGKAQQPSRALHREATHIPDG